MNSMSRNRAAKPLWMLSAMFLLLPLGNFGCSIGGDQVLPPQLERRIASNATAEDHLAAALLYQQEARLASSEATQYEQAAASIRAIEDPKGFRRAALMTAAQTHQHYAGEMQQLYAAHQTKADTMMGKHQPQ